MMWLDHDVVIGLMFTREDFKFYPSIEIPDQFSFTFLVLLRKLCELPFPLEVLHIELDPSTQIPQTQLISGCPKERLDPILDEFGAKLRSCKLRVNALNESIGEEE